MQQFHRINLFELVLSLSSTLDLVSPAMANHHKRVAYVCLCLAKELKLAEQEKQDLVLAASLHDIGVLSLRERLTKRRFEANQRTSRFGYQLLRKFLPFQAAASIVRFHHVPWDGGLGSTEGDEMVPRASHLLHLADHLESLVDAQRPIMAQADDLRAAIAAHRGGKFVPMFVDAFDRLAAQEWFWLDLVSPSLDRFLAQKMAFSMVELELDSLLDFTAILAHVIDFRSRFTATHSSGVAASAEALARVVGFSSDACKRIKVAGHLHDIGKLAIPLEILERPGPLSAADRRMMSAHPYYSHRILDQIAGFSDIAAWCGLHHEHLDGSGYPFHCEEPEIPLEARIIGVADVFVALSEARPYRGAMPKERVMAVLRDMGGRRALDPTMVQHLCRHYDAIDACRSGAQQDAEAIYDQFMESLYRLDLSAARDAHLAWKDRLQGFLEGKGTLTREQVVSHHDCALGKWYYGEGLRSYGRVQEMHALEEPHRELHRIMADLIAHREAGREQEAQRCFSLVEPLSRRIVELLEQIERRVAAEFPRSVDPEQWLPESESARGTLAREA